MTLRRKILFMLIMCLLPLAMMEGLLQAYYRLSVGSWLWQRSVLPIYEADPVRCYRTKANLDQTFKMPEFSFTVRTDANGLRIPEDGNTAQPGGPKVLFAGPSFTFGWGVSYAQSFPALTHHMLLENDLPFQLVNLATPAQPPEQQICWIQANGTQVAPDVVVQTIYPRPDSLAPGCAQLTCPVIENGYLYTTKPTLLKRVVATARNSALVFYGWTALSRVMPSHKTTGAGDELYHTAQVGEDMTKLVALYKNHQAAVRAAVGRDIPVVYLFIPLSYMVHPEDAARWRHVEHLSEPALEAWLDATQKALAAEGITFINPLPQLRANAQKGRQYYWLDVHYTPAGNQATADALAPVLANVLEKINAPR